MTEPISRESLSETEDSCLPDMTGANSIEWQIAMTRWERFKSTGESLDHDEIEAWAQTLSAKRCTQPSLKT